MKAILMMDMPENCMTCSLCNGNDECIMQDEDANFAADTISELMNGCPLVQIRDLFEPEEYAKGRCDGCEYRKRVYAQGGYSFYGCYCRPYTGKRVSEIKNCPKKPEREEYIESCAEYEEIGTMEEC